MRRFTESYIGRMWAARARATSPEIDEAEAKRLKRRAEALRQIEAAGFSGDAAVRLLTDPRADTQRGLMEVLDEARKPLAFTAQAAASVYARRGRK